MGKDGKKKKASRLKYKLDLAFAGGTKKLLLALLTIIVTVVISVGCLVSVFFGKGNIIEGMALTLQHLTSTAELISDFGNENPIYWLIMLMVTLIGIGTYGTFIGIITSYISNKMNDLSEGHSKIIEEGHVVMLGFSDNTHIMIEEMNKSNENWTGDKYIVVAGEKSKKEMEDRFGNIRHLLFRSGNPCSEDMLDAVSVEKARIVIISHDDDFETVRNLLALIPYLKKCDAYLNEKMPVISVLVHDQESVSLAEIAAGIQQESDDVRNPYEEKIRILYLDNILAHIFAQSCRQPGLSWVVSQICDYEGSEVYLEDTAANGQPLEKAFAGKTFREISGRLEKSIALGVQRGRDVILNPDPDIFLFEKGDKLIHLAEDDHKITLSRTGQKNLLGELGTARLKSENDCRNFLVLGWNEKTSILLREMDAYYAKGSRVKIYANSENISVQGKNMQVSSDRVDPYEWSNIRPYLEENLLSCKDPAMRLTNIVIVSESSLDGAEADKKTITVFLHLKEYFRSRKLEQQVTVTAEINLPFNQRLLSQTNSIDFIRGSRLSGRILVMVSNNYARKDVFIRLFCNDGPGFCFRSFDEYVDITRPFNFRFVQNVATERVRLGKGKQEIAVGWMRTGDTKSATIVRLNPTGPERDEPFRFVFADDTFRNYKLIVIADDENQEKDEKYATETTRNCENDRRLVP